MEGASMPPSPERIRASLLLTNRLVALGTTPLTAREFWRLVDRVDPAELLGADVATIAERAGIADDEAVRYRALLDAATALSFEQERLADGGVSLVSALDDSFPPRLREHLGERCPPFLLVAGPIESLARPGLGIVGSRDASDAALGVARQAAELAGARGWPVVSGLARGVDQAAMNGAHEVGGAVVGIPAEGIGVASRSAEVRRRVHAGELCLASPYAPDARFSAARALGRNKIVYALSKVTFVVASVEGTGGTWAGATEAIEHRYARVAVWTSDGATDGNHALARRGATAITELPQLFDVDDLAPRAPAPSQPPLF
jgi:predicted Rossmann fold nucleotide-binding protein DprA/Smf involved in DNA uptake